MEEKERDGRAYSSVGHLRQVVARLRAEDGCPWDRAQTMESLKPCLVNEMTEALAGIDLYRRTGDADNLCEELGDVLMLVVFLSQIAEEGGLFGLEDVAERVCRKMIRRHPHVFGGPAASGSAEAARTWEEIKQEEKREKAPGQDLLEKEAFREAAAQVVRQLTSDS